MKAAIENAAKLAKEEKRKQQRKHVSIAEEEVKEKPASVRSTRDTKQPDIKKYKSPRLRKIKPQETVEYVTTNKTPRPVEKPADKLLKDSSCQFEHIKPLTNLPFMSPEQFTLDGGLALVLDTPHHRLQADNGLLLPPEGVQLALLMSPGMSAGNTLPLSLASITPSILDTSLNLSGRMSQLQSTSGSATGRLLTPTKYRESDKRPVKITADQSTQTQTRYSGGRVSLFNSKKTRKHGRNSGRLSGHSDSSEK
jgi:hypothetical protein